jgi:hypothetical protein
LRERLTGRRVLLCAQHAVYLQHRSADGPKLRKTLEMCEYRILDSLFRENAACLKIAS